MSSFLFRVLVRQVLVLVLVLVLVGPVFVLVLAGLVLVLVLVALILVLVLVLVGPVFVNITARRCRFSGACSELALSTSSATAVPAENCLFNSSLRPIADLW